MSEQTGQPTPVSMLNKPSNGGFGPFQPMSAPGVTTPMFQQPFFQQPMNQQPNNTFNFNMPSWDQVQQQVQSPIQAPSPAAPPAAQPSAPEAPDWRAAYDRYQNNMGLGTTGTAGYFGGGYKGGQGTLAWDDYSLIKSKMPGLANNLNAPYAYKPLAPQSNQDWW